MEYPQAALFPYTYLNSLVLEAFCISITKVKLISSLRSDA